MPLCFNQCELEKGVYRLKALEYGMWPWLTSHCEYIRKLMGCGEGSGVGSDLVAGQSLRLQWYQERGGDLSITDQ